jgi:predicted lipid-binding transport protein (Tim44 family)
MPLPDNNNNNAPSLLVEGLSDAIGFIGGALGGFWLGRLLGADIFAAGYGTMALIGIVLVGIGGGLGLKLARRWRATRGAQASADTGKRR